MASKKKEVEVNEVIEESSKIKKSPNLKKLKKPAKAEKKIKMAEVAGSGISEDEIDIGDPEVEEELEAVGESVEDDGVEIEKIPEVAVEDSPEEEGGWKPKTKLGKLVKSGEVTLEQIFETGQIIREPEIIDTLLPGIEEKMILIGGSPGKGGGIQRRPSRRTVRVHKSGRRTSVSMMTIVGDKRGYLGIGVGKAANNKGAREKSLIKAKLSLFPIKKGCGSWECGCGEGHSIPFTIHGKAGSVEVKLMPAPKGLGLCVTDEMKKLFEISGIKDVRIKTRGKTHSRMNFIYAIEDALKNINKIKQ